MHTDDDQPVSVQPFTCSAEDAFWDRDGVFEFSLAPSCRKVFKERDQGLGLEDLRAIILSFESKSQVISWRLSIIV